MLVIDELYTIILMLVLNFVCYYYYTEMPTVRFEAEQPLEVEESGGPVRVCARVNLGNEETIPVTFTTVDGTAKGMSSTCHFYMAYFEV